MANTCYPDCKVNGSVDPQNDAIPRMCVLLGQIVLFIALNTLSSENGNIFKNRITKKITYGRFRILCASVINNVS